MTTSPTEEAAATAQRRPGRGPWSSAPASSAARWAWPCGPGAGTSAAPTPRPGTAARGRGARGPRRRGGGPRGRPGGGGHPGPRGRRRDRRRSWPRPAGTPTAVVTDVGSVKGPLVAAVDRPRFVGGHPMAGSEQVGHRGRLGRALRGGHLGADPDADHRPRRLRPGARRAGRARGQRGGPRPRPSTTPWWPWSPTCPT